MRVGEHFCQEIEGETGGRRSGKAGGHDPVEKGTLLSAPEKRGRTLPKIRAGTSWRLESATKNRRPDEPSRLACRELACQAHRARRSKKKSGRRDSNPRQPAWKAGTYRNTARLVQIGLSGRFIDHSSFIRTIDKSCHKAFFGLLTKAFAYFRRQELRGSLQVRVYTLFLLKASRVGKYPTIGFSIGLVA